MKSVLPYFTPTEVILVDDDVITLQEQKTILNPSVINLTSFENPFEALNYINNHSVEAKQQNGLDSLYRQIYSSERFKQISTIIVDYDMPGLNGLDLCRQITAPHVQKIMLTGAATMDVAIEAFNEGIIHQFIQKNDQDVFAKLQQASVRAQEKYFESRTFELMHHLQNECPEISIVYDSIFIDFFRKLMLENKIVEYYLLDPVGNFLFLSNDGKPSVLFVFNEELLESQEDMILENDRSTDLAQEVYAKKQAICFYPFNNQEKYEPANWKNYLHPLNRIEAKSPLFYAYVSDLPYLDQTKIVNFKDYLFKAEK
ncbi:MAG: response regulator [Candidatus Nucleicultricaceae bacterium]